MVSLAVRWHTSSSVGCGRRLSPGEAAQSEGGGTGGFDGIYKLDASFEENIKDWPRREWGILRREEKVCIIGGGYRLSLSLSKKSLAGLF